MGFNYGLKKKKFDMKWRRLRTEYESAGMAPDAIQKIYDFDVDEFKRRRIEALHTQSFTSDSSGGIDDGDESTLLNKFISTLSVSIDDLYAHSRYWWIEEINDPQLTAKIKKLPASDIELLTLIVMEGYSQVEVAARLQTTKQNINNKLARLKKVYFERVLLAIPAAYHMREKNLFSNPMEFCSLTTKYHSSNTFLLLRAIAAETQ